MTRAEQLRVAKRKQRLREKRAGLAAVEVRVPEATAERLRLATHGRGFRDDLEAFVRERVLDLNEWPALRELAWNRADRWILAEEALALYERNWRFVDVEALTKKEATLIQRLRERFGGGVMNA